MEWIIIGAVAVIAFLIIISNISVVQQSRAYVIERLGAFQSVWAASMKSGAWACTSRLLSLTASPAVSASRSRFWTILPSP